MVKRIKVPVPPKGPGDERNSQSIYVNTRVKKLMGSWHPDYNPQLHKCKYLHGSVMMACGYRRWIVWWDDGFNWNKLYTGAGYHSSGLVKCDMDQQGFSDITPGQISDMTATIRGIVDDNVSGDDDEPEEDLPATGLASNKNKNPHATFVHHNQVTPPAKQAPSKKRVKFNHMQDKNHLFRFFEESSPTTEVDNQQVPSCESDSERSAHSCVPTTEDVEKAKFVNTPNDEDSVDTARQNEIIPHCTETSELDRWKDQMKKLEGVNIDVPYDGKKKTIQWRIEGIVTTKNTHDETPSDFHPVYDYRTMDPDVVNPLKNFLEVFPENEMMRCIETFNIEARNEVYQASPKKNLPQNFFRNKNSSYLKKLTLKEFKIFLGLLLAATTRVESGINLWKMKRSTTHYFNNAPGFGRFMSFTRFQKIRKFFSKCFSDPSVRDTDPWWNIIGGVNQFNNIRKRTFTHVPIVVLDESMCAWRPRTTKTGGLPHLTYEQRKPESLGTEFKTTACGMTGCMLNLEIMRGCETMKKQVFNKSFGHCTGLVLRMTEKVQNYEYTHHKKVADTTINVSEDENHRDDWMVQCEISDKQLVLGDSYFSSVKTAIQTMKKYGRHYVGIVKTAHAKFPKAYIQNIMKKAPTGAHILLTTFHEGVYLCALGYKFSKKEKVSMMIFTRGAGTTKTTDSHYYQRRNDPFGNVYDKVVERPEIAHTYFTYCGAIDYHNKQRQGHLRLEKKWKTQDPWFRLSTSLIGMHTVDAYQLYRYNVDKKTQVMTVLEFAEILGTQLLHNNFDDLDQYEDDPDQLPYSEKEFELIDIEKYDPNNFEKYYHCRNARIAHQLVKTELKYGKKGKKYHKTNDCLVCKNFGVRRQSTFVCQACGVALCSPVLIERTQAPRDCFRVYHEKLFCVCDFSVASDADEDTNDSDDNVEEVQEVHVTSTNRKRNRTGNLKIAEV